MGGRIRICKSLQSVAGEGVREKHSLENSTKQTIPDSGRHLLRFLTLLGGDPQMVNDCRLNGADVSNRPFWQHATHLSLGISLGQLTSSRHLVNFPSWWELTALVNPFHLNSFGSAQSNWLYLLFVRIWLSILSKSNVVLLFLQKKKKKK